MKEQENIVGEDAWVWEHDVCGNGASELIRCSGKDLVRRVCD